MKRLAFVAVVLALLLNACGANVVPTVDPAQVQASVVAEAGTMLAQTQAAIPPTQLPTDTPEPSPTPQPSPTLDTSSTASIIPTQTPSSANADSCDVPLSSQSAGTGKISGGTGNVLIVNDTKATITVSLQLAKNKLGQCGYLSYELARGQSKFLPNVLPYGCYYLHAFVNDPKKPSQPSGGPACITGPDKTTFTVLADTIKVTGP